MKKTIMALFVFIGVATSVNAQTGSTLLYGMLEASSHKDAAGNKSSDFSLLPGIGYQFNDNWTMGLNLGYQTVKTTPFGLASYSTNAFGIGPFIRYAKPLTNIFSVYGQFDATYWNSKPDGGIATNTFDAKLWPAVGVNIKNGFGLNFAFGGLEYSTSKVKGASTSSSNFDLTFGTGASFGISKNFGGQAEHHGRRWRNRKAE